MKMEFCEECGNILLPKKKENKLFCRVCKKDFPVKAKEKKILEQYKKVTTKKNLKYLEKKRALKTAVVVVKSKTKSMTEEEREAFGELLEMSGE
jgi:DNA-directed RNA polymerase subunit M/transcription elongation factor TFIIS